MGGLGVKVQHFPLTLLVVLTILTLPCERDCIDGVEGNKVGYIDSLSSLPFRSSSLLYPLFI